MQVHTRNLFENYLLYVCIVAFSYSIIATAIVPLAWKETYSPMQKTQDSKLIAIITSLTMVIVLLCSTLVSHLKNRKECKISGWILGVINEVVIRTRIMVFYFTHTSSLIFQFLFVILVITISHLNMV